MATAHDTNLHKQEEKLLTCCICDETLKEPRTLGCFHSFCKKCLAENVESQRMKAEKRRDHLLECPLCRTQFQLKQEESVEQIRPCLFINNLLELSRIQDRASQISCDSCKGKVVAVSRCIECEDFFCENCLTAHNNLPKFAKHVRLTLEELTKPENQSKAKPIPRCDKEGHQNKRLDYYCNYCNKLACKNCILLDHKEAEHVCQPTSVLGKQQKEALKPTSASLKKLFDENQNALEKIRQASKKLETCNKMAKNAILEQEREILEAFTKKLKHTTAAMIVDVDRKHNEINQKLVKQHDDMKNYVEKVNGSLEFAKNMLEKGGNEDILSLGNKIKENAIDLEKKSPNWITSPVHSGYFLYKQIKSAQNIVDKVDLKEFGKVGKFNFLINK